MSAQKIDSNRLKTFGMVIALFQLDEENKKFCFLEETFLLADISISSTFGMFFLILNNVKVNFQQLKAQLRLYTVVEAFSIIKKVELIRERELTAAILD